MSELLKINDEIGYDPESGRLYWLKKKGCRAAGQEAGTKRANGYISVFLNGKRQYAHRLAVLAMTGSMPANVVDHINGDRSDNRWQNLRAVTQSENMSNRRGAQRNSKTGLLGASPHVAGGFVAQIRRNKKLRYLGYFDNPQDAHKAYTEAANECL